MHDRLSQVGPRPLTAGFPRLGAVVDNVEVVEGGRPVGEAHHLG